MFKKRRYQRSTDNPVQDKVAGRIAGFLVKLQTGFANRMNRRFEKVDPQKMKIWLAGFCIVSGGFSIYFFAEAILSTPASSIKIEPIRLPQNFNKTGDEIIDNRIAGETYLQIQHYRRYMDSMGLPIRPGLLDSIQLLEKLYTEQQKIK